MSEAGGAPAGRDGRSRSGHDGPCYAALDLGTNNCRLLIARPAPGGFRVVEAFSRIVRLGEGLSRTGRLSAEAMDRAAQALRICAARVARRRIDPSRLRAVATQACRSAENGAEFLGRVEAESGLRLDIIDPVEEARLSVAGCLNLLDPAAEAVLVIDVGGGSTELSWLRRRGNGQDGFHTETWMSAPLGVVTLAERHPEPPTSSADWYEAMVNDVRAVIDLHRPADPLKAVFDEGRAHLVGTSGAITSLAGIHLGLTRYERDRVDGLWLTADDCRAAAGRLTAMGPAGRAAEPCIGPDRADLVLAGAAILEAVQRSWPCERVRVADRGLREGMLLSMMHRRKRRRRRR